ncbi:MAG: hypothetical protein K2L55_07165 [Muribaculaceae bacterium]|nr:hypothetical protein [Muribaculaceae bacterium]
MKRLFYITTAFVAGMVAAGVLAHRHKGNDAAQSAPLIRTETIYDTIPYLLPMPRDSVVVRYETHRLPVTEALCDTIAGVDSVEVAVPITRKEYEDSTYHAWISGYHVSLDSICTYSRHDYTTVKQPTAKPRRWHLGVSAGYGCGPQGFQPYIGLGITYSIISF